MNLFVSHKLFNIRKKKDIFASNGRKSSPYLFCKETEALWRHGPPGSGLL